MNLRVYALCILLVLYQQQQQHQQQQQPEGREGGRDVPPFHHQHHHPRGRGRGGPHHRGHHHNAHHNSFHCKMSKLLMLCLCQLLVLIKIILCFSMHTRHNIGWSVFMNTYYLKCDKLGNKLCKLKTKGACLDVMKLENLQKV